MKKLMVGIAALGLLTLFAPAQGARIHRCLGKAATIVGTRGADRIRGTSGQDVVVARGGADTISGFGANPENRDYLCGGRGRDTIYVQSKAGFDTCAGGVAFASGGMGDDRLFGGGLSFTGSGDAGDDLIDGCRVGDKGATFYNAPAPVKVKLWSNSATGRGQDTLKHIDSIYGSPYNDLIVGSNRTELESLSGAGGADTIKGLGDPDYLFGGAGVDNLDSRDDVVANDILDGEDDGASCLYDTSEEGEDHAVNCNV